MSRMMAFVCCLMTVIWSCSDSSGPTNDNDDTTKPATVQQTVGSNGGTVESGGMTLDIPGGLLTVDTEIVLSETVDTTYGDDALTPTYTIEGIPQSFSGTVTINIKYEGEPPDVVGIAVGEEYEDIIGGGTGIFYDLVSAQIENGWITCEISSESAQNKTHSLTKNTALSVQDTGDRIVRYAKGVKDIKKSIKGRFHVEHHVFWEDSVPDLCNYLESALDTFMQMGFIFRSKDNTIVGGDHIKVNIQDISENDHELAGYSIKDVDGNNSALIEIDFDEKVLGLTEEKRRLMKNEAGKAVFSIFTFMATPQTFNQENQNYFLRALHEWAGFKMVNDKTFVPEYFKGNENAAFLGLDAGKGKSGNESKTFGQCMSALIKYLDETNGADGTLIRSVLDKMADSEDEITALLNSASQPVNEWWPEFVQSYLSGDVYPIDTETLFGSLSGTYTIDSASHPAKPFSGSYGDLSAKIYKITLEHKEGDPDRSFTFSTEGQVNPDFLTILLYKKDSSGNMKLFKKGSEITITSLKEFTAQETGELYAVVVNSACKPPYTETSNITFKIATKEKNELPPAPIEDPGLVFVTIRGGSFDMGSEIGSTVNQPVHRVTLDGFEMTETEITNEQYKRFLNAALATGDVMIIVDEDKDGKTLYYPWSTKSPGVRDEFLINLYNGSDTSRFVNISYDPSTFFSVVAGKGQHPVGRVTWDGAVAFAEYYNCRLPTEAEWEYACRAGTTTNYYTGDDDESVLEAAWDWENAGREAHPVREKTPNDWGLYDMHGNINEWCHDIYSSRYYDESPEHNPIGAEAGNQHVLRGGSYYGALPSWARQYSNFRGETFGFRVVSD